MKVLVDILDSESVFGMRVLESLSFVKETNPISDSALLLWENLEDAAKDVRLHRDGKLKLKTAKELLDEL
jgi:hypothetical protein